MYKIYEKLRDAKGLTDYRVSQDTAIPRSCFADWKAGRSVPKVDKLMKLADYFGVPLETFVKN